jgi:FkbM family methyltransferase
MDLGRIKAHGRSTTGRAWVTNPLRSMLWWLTAPYFQGVDAEIEQCYQTMLASLRTETAAEIEQRSQTVLASLRTETATEIEQRAQTALASLRREAATEIEHLFQTALARLQTEAAAAVASYTAGGRKDSMAIAHRLAGLEEEAAGNRLACITLDERIGLVAAEAHEAGAYVASLHKDVRSSVQALNERIDGLASSMSSADDQTALANQDLLVLTPTAAGTHFLVRRHDLIGRQVADGQEWEPHVRRAIERAASPDAVAVDAGAYIGLHTVTMSRNFGRIHAFEPQPGIYRLLCANLALNGCANVVTHNLALYDRGGSMRLAPPERQEVPIPLRDGEPDYVRISNAAALTFEIVDNGSGDVRAMALDELALEGVTLIKVDTQGADLRVLRGAEATIQRCRPVILFEWERDLGRQHGAALEDYHSFFAGLDYVLVVLQETTTGRQADYLARPR